MNQTQFISIPRSQGLWLSFEGIDGCGKSTQIKKLEAALISNGFEVLSLREPGGTFLGEAVRQLILESTQPIMPLSESYLFLAARSQLLSEKIIPWLSHPKRVVLSDRYIDSTIVYQGVAGKLGMETILKLHQVSPLNYLPHRTFYLQISPNVSLSRQAIRGQNKDYFEQKGISFLNELVGGYDQLVTLFPQRILTLNGELDSEMISQSIQLEVKQLCLNH
jgi:dTMP kinase